MKLIHFTAEGGNILTALSEAASCISVNVVLQSCLRRNITALSLSSGLRWSLFSNGRAFDSRHDRSLNTPAKYAFIVTLSPLTHFPLPFSLHPPQLLKSSQINMVINKRGLSRNGEQPVRPRCPLRWEINSKRRLIFACRQHGAQTGTICLHEITRWRG